MNKAKAKGTSAESAVVAYLRDAGFKRAERRTLNGANDRGDIAGIDGVVIEVKNCQTLSLPQWLRELEAEMKNEAKHQFVITGGDGRTITGIIIAKRKGTTDVGEWYAIQTVSQWVEQLIDKEQNEHG